VAQISFLLASPKECNFTSRSGSWYRGMLCAKDTIQSNACSHFCHHLSKASGIGASHRTMASQISLYINFLSNNTPPSNNTPRDTKPNRSYTFAKNARIPLFVNTAGIVGNTTLNESVTLSHGRPNSLLSAVVKFPLLLFGKHRLALNTV
jgi:hypothetical protein